MTAASEPDTTGVFTEAERRYLRDQPLMRFASASLAGKPDVSPVAFEVDGDTVVSGGLPRVIISWGINDTTPGIPAMERREA